MLWNSERAKVNRKPAFMHFLFIVWVCLVREDFNWVSVPYGIEWVNTSFKFPHWTLLWMTLLTLFISFSVTFAFGMLLTWAALTMHTARRVRLCIFVLVYTGSTTHPCLLYRARIPALYTVQATHTFLSNLCALQVGDPQQETTWTVKKLSIFSICPKWYISHASIHNDNTCSVWIYVRDSKLCLLFK